MPWLIFGGLVLGLYLAFRPSADASPSSSPLSTPPAPLLSDVGFVPTTLTATSTPGQSDAALAQSLGLDPSGVDTAANAADEADRLAAGDGGVAQGQQSTGSTVTNPTNNASPPIGN